MVQESLVGSSSQSSPQMSYNLLEDRIKMEFCFFGKREDLSGPVEWAAHDRSMVPLMSCQCDMSLWFQGKYPGLGASGSRGRSTERSSGSNGKKLQPLEGILKRTELCFVYRVLICDDISICKQKRRLRTSFSDYRNI